MGEREPVGDYCAGDCGDGGEHGGAVLYCKVKDRKGYR